MTTTSERIPRLLLELPWLISNKKVSMKTFCSQFDLNLEQAVEDLALLTFVGPGKYGGELVDIQYDDESIRVINSQGLNRAISFSSSEAMVLMLGVKQIIDNSRDVSTAKIVENKLLVLIDDSYVIGDLQKYNKFKNQLEVSLKNNNAVEIDYVNSVLGASSKRVVQVTKLYNSEGNNYFDAIDSKSGKVKTFRIDRIVTLRELNQELTKTIPVQSDSNSFKVKITTKPWFTSRIASLGLKHQIIDNLLVIEMEFYDEEFLLDLLLRLDAEAKIESSEKVKKETLKILDERIKRMK